MNLTILKTTSSMKPTPLIIYNSKPKKTLIHSKSKLHHSKPTLMISTSQSTKKSNSTTLISKI